MKGQLRVASCDPSTSLRAWLREKGPGRHRRPEVVHLATRGSQLATFLLLACSQARVGARDPGSLRAPDERAVSSHVVVISIDGLRPDAIEQFGAATLRRMMDEGSYTLEARTIDPSRTLPSHVSMLTGVPPSVHGITWNSDETKTRGVVQVPTVFDVARKRGLRTAAFFSKAKFHHLERPGSLDYVLSPRGPRKQFSGERTVDDLERYLRQARPNLLFVHLPDVDEAGHRRGWMGASYGRAVRQTDALVARVRDAAERAFGAGGYTLIVTADHGGSDKGHGGTHANHVNIPWIAWGRGVRPATQLPAGVRTMDTAATVLWLLAVDVPREWTGVPVAGAFAARAADAAAP